MHQVSRIFGAELGSRVVEMHSGLPPSQRLRTWLRVREGEADLVIGPRSAVFAPLPRLGLIIIDEEHEGSYKAGSTPRYHARQVAFHRAGSEGCRLLMGSATPSVEAMHSMSQGRIARLDLPDRLAGGRLPAVEVVDMKRESGVLSRRLLEALRDAHAEGRQSILFLNRRGFSYYFYCRSCGYEMKCRRCSVALTYHKARDRMVCHYCGASAAPVAVCPECGSLDVGSFGLRHGKDRGGAGLDLPGPAHRTARYRHGAAQERAQGDADGVPRRPAGRAGRHPDGRQGARLSGRQGCGRRERRYGSAAPGLQGARSGPLPSSCRCPDGRAG